GADHKHALVLNVEGEEGKKTLKVTFSYAREGSAIIAPYTDTYTARKRQALWTEDGSLALAMTFYPKKFEREDTSRDDKTKLAPDDSGYTLGGNLFKWRRPDPSAVRAPGSRQPRAYPRGVEVRRPARCIADCARSWGGQ